MLSSDLAQQIASDITEVIGHNVLITDANGMVLGSGDRTRVGQFHEASVGVARTKTTRSHTAADVASLEGSLPGVTLPLIQDNEVVGTVGLSGPPGMVSQFGQIVKRQTEILLSEANRIGIRASRQRAADDLMREVFELHRSTGDHRTLTRRAQSLGFDVEVPRRVVVARVVDHHLADRRTAFPEPDLGTGMIELMRERFDQPSDLKASLSRSVVAVMTSTPAQQLRQRCSGMVAQAAARGWTLRIGIGTTASGFAQLNSSAHDARDALELGERFATESRIHDIADLRLLQALRAIPEAVAQRYSEAVLGAVLAQPDWPELRQTLLAWGECGFNIKRAAERMHVHRNTLLYRLQKIQRLTGQEAVQESEPVVLYVAATLADMSFHWANR
jgi:carbohydrate diacid regulator